MARSNTPATVVCNSCGHSVLLKGGDRTGWKSVQPYPDREVLWNYCPKLPCREAFDAAVEFAKKQWGWTPPEEETDDDS